MAGEDKTDTFEETVSTPEGKVEEYKVQSVTTPEEESVSAKAKEAGRSLRELVYSLGRKTKK